MSWYAIICNSSCFLEMLFATEIIKFLWQFATLSRSLSVEIKSFCHLYFFSADTAWLKYEHLQAEVFDHILAMLNVFDLKVFQSPTGMDLQKMS